MTTSHASGVTAVLAEWAAGYRLETAPPEIVERMQALLLDYLRVTAVGAPLPWSRAARALALELGGKTESSLLLCGSRVDAARAAFVNGAYAHACDLDDTHVGSMHHAGASIWPAVLAVAERENSPGRAVLEAVEADALRAGADKAVPRLLPTGQKLWRLPVSARAARKWSVCPFRRSGPACTGCTLLVDGACRRFGT